MTMPVLSNAETKVSTTTMKGCSSSARETVEIMSTVFGSTQNDHSILPMKGNKQI